MANDKSIHRKLSQPAPDTVYNPQTGGSHIDITPMYQFQPGVKDTTKPQTFTDKNLDPQMQPGDPSQRITSQPAKPGGSISPELNAPKQTSKGVGSSKPDPEGLTKI